MLDVMVWASRLKLAPAPVDRSSSGTRSSVLNFAPSHISESTLDTIAASKLSVTLAYSPSAQRSLIWRARDAGASNAVSGVAAAALVPIVASATPAIGRTIWRRSSLVSSSPPMAQSAVYLFLRNTPNPGWITISDFQRKFSRGLGGDTLNVGTCDRKMANRSSNAVPERVGGA